MDYRKHLGKKESAVLAYLGGSTVCTARRRLRVEEPLTEGWWRFRVEGRAATPEEQTQAPDLSGLPRRRGAYAHGWLFETGTKFERLFCLPEEQPELFAPISARVWHSGHVLFENVEFETEVEEAVRRSIEEETRLEGLKGVTPAMRAAYALALARKLAARRQVWISPRELSPFVRDVAEQGLPAVERVFEHLRLERERAQQRGRERAIGPTLRVARSRAGRPAEERVEKALSEAHAELLATRRLGEAQLEVGFRFMGERFVCIVDAVSLQVLDAGICLEGADRELNLDSLPAVIREAIQTSQLVITRR